jgi:YHS domain-containing protein
MIFSESITMRIVWIAAIPFMILSSISISGADTQKASTSKEALQPFNLLIGSWKGSGIPEGTPDERQKGHWTEKVTWGWQFKGDDAWISVTFEDGKHFSKGELRHIADKNLFELKLTTTDKKAVTFQGSLKEKQLALERVDEPTKETQRIVFSLLHHNRFLYRLEVKPADKTFFTKLYQVGATKEGVPFAEVGHPERECVVSGGEGTIAVSYNGKTYYVCCTGCRDAFKETPEKFVKEFEEKRKKKN